VNVQLGNMTNWDDVVWPRQHGDLQVCLGKNGELSICSETAPCYVILILGGKISCCVCTFLPYTYSRLCCSGGVTRERQNILLTPAWRRLQSHWRSWIFECLQGVYAALAVYPTFRSHHLRGIRGSPFTIERGHLFQGLPRGLVLGHACQRLWNKLVIMLFPSIVEQSTTLKAISGR
jgi:hypothetical protein